MTDRIWVRISATHQKNDFFEMRVTKFIRVTNKDGRPTQVEPNRQTNITMRRTDNTFQFDMPDEANLSEIYEILR